VGEGRSGAGEGRWGRCMAISSEGSKFSKRRNVEELVIEEHKPQHSPLSSPGVQSLIQEPSQGSDSLWHLGMPEPRPPVFPVCLRCNSVPSANSINSSSSPSSSPRPLFRTESQELEQWKELMLSGNLTPPPTPTAEYERPKRNMEARLGFASHRSSYHTAAGSSARARKGVIAENRAKAWKARRRSMDCTSPTSPARAGSEWRRSSVIAIERREANGSPATSPKVPTEASSYRWRTWGSWSGKHKQGTDTSQNHGTSAVSVGPESSRDSRTPSPSFPSSASSSFGVGPPLDHGAISSTEFANMARKGASALSSELTHVKSRLKGVRHKNQSHSHGSRIIFFAFNRLDWAFDVPMLAFVLLLLLLCSASVLSDPRSIRSAIES